MALIDNQNQTLQEALKNALPTSDRVDIAVGFFYFSGFQALANELKEKKVRILVGLEVDPGKVAQIAQLSREFDVDLNTGRPMRPTTSRTALRKNYVDSLIGFINDSDVFDDSKSEEVLSMFVNKIADGTLEIRKTPNDYHGKYYILHNNSAFSQNGDFPGTGVSGSSNLTYNGLRGQGELNESQREKGRFEEYAQLFGRMWSESIAIADTNTKDAFVEEIKAKVWRYVAPRPYYVYLRVLHEIFSQEETESLLTPGAITNNRYSDLQYQIDAVRSVIDRLNKYDGVLLA